MSRGTSSRIWPGIRRNITEHLRIITEDGAKYHLARLLAMGARLRKGPDFGGR